MRFGILPLSVGLALTSLATAQTCITSPFAGGSGGVPGGAVYFSVDVVPTGGVTFTSLDLNLNTAPIGNTVGCEVWARFGSGYSGNESAPGWYFVAEGTGTMAGTGSPTSMTLSAPFWLPAGTNALAVVATGGASHTYSVGSGANQTVTDSVVTLSLGSATSVPFFGAPFTPRVANCTLCYNLGGTAAYPNFRVGTPAGALPLFVDFTNLSYSFDASGVQLWRWDFDGDGTFDIAGNSPAEQNPQWIYGTAGSYDVTLEITDATGVYTRTMAGAVQVGDLTTNSDSADLLHYVFNEPPRVGNLGVYNAASSDLAPEFATISNDNWQGETGRPMFQGAETGFGCLDEAGVISSGAINTGLPLKARSMTIAWWHRIGQFGAGTANAFAYVFGGPGSDMRCFIDGAAGTGMIRYTGTAAGNVNTVTNIKAGFADVWTHLALVVDDVAGTATWYINGAQDVQVNYTPGTHIVNRDQFWVGYHSGTQNYTTFYSMDDFRFYSRALSPTEVATVAGGVEPAVATVYGTGCPGAGAVVPTIGASGGAPSVGNSGFTIELDNLEPNSFGGFAFGYYANQLTAAGGPLPFDISGLGLGFAAGCNVEIGELAALGFNFQATGATSQPLPIPINPALSGAHLYVQGVAIGSVFCLSDALDISMK